MIAITAVKSGKEQIGPGALAGISLAQFILALDYSIVYLALPSMAKDLGLDTALSQWIVSAYGLMFGGFLLLGGRLCDRFGAHGTFAAAVCLFSAASLLGGLAGNGAWLILARGAQGIGAAALQPALLSMIAAHFPSGPSRAKALSIWGAVGALGLVAGVLLGGVFTLFSWRLVFFINFPIGMLCLWLLKRKMMPGTAPRHRAPIPVLAALSGTLAMMSVVLWLTSLAQAGLDDIHTHAWAGAAVVGSLIFFAGEKLGPRPLVARALRRLPGLRTGCWTSACYMASAGAEFFLLTLLLQNVYGYGALRAGLCFLPMAALIVIGNVLAGKLMGKMTAERVLFGGFALAAFGLWLLALSLAGGAFRWRFAVGLLLSGLGHGIIYAANFAAGLKELPEDRQGTGSGLLVTAQYVGGAIALSLLVILLGYYPGETGYYYSFTLLAFFALSGAAAALAAEN